MSKNVAKIRIKISAYDHHLINDSINRVIDLAEKYGSKIVGPVPLPVEIKKYTVNRSTFVHKDSREQFEMRIHKRLIDIIEPSNRLMESMMNLNLPTGVNIEVKM
ncbi:MAG TPA: 30S ribosomal protein S10 [Candidatus Portnoybacteria bacterium]|nr:30S ribosomal protein S10 [Candidatus Portnoybacteria bacterium]